MGIKTIVKGKCRCIPTLNELHPDCPIHRASAPPALRIRRAAFGPAPRGVSGYVRAMRRVRTLRERVERMRERVRPHEDALRRALADAQARRARLTGGALADAARRLSADVVDSRRTPDQS